MSLNRGTFFLTLFGMIPLAVGVVLGTISLRTLSRAEVMKSWQSTPATVIACDLNVSRSSKGGASYCVSAQYQYEVNGTRYVGTRVSPHSGSDNIGSFHQRVYAELKQCMDRQAQTLCWVNPQNPAEAILKRSPRPEMLIFMQLFVLVFGGAGVGIVLSGLSGLLQPSVSAEASIGQGQIRMRGASAHRVAGVFAVAWNGYIGFFLWKTFGVMAPEVLPWYLWLLAATGVIPALFAGYLIGRIRKFGVSVFEMSPMPGVLGGPVAGTIRIPAKVETEDGFDVVLQCIHQYTTGSGKNSSTHRDVLWDETRHLDGGLSYGEATLLPVRFAAPYDKPATTVAGGSSGYYWRLNVTAAAPGIDYKAVFDVPVKRTAQSSATFAQQPASAVAVAGPVRADEVAERSSLRLEPRSDGGFELVFPAARALAEGLFLALFAAGWTATCVALWTVAKTPVFFALLFTFIDVFVLWALVNTLVVSRGIIIDRARHECVTWWQMPGLPKRERHIPFEAVLDIRSERAGQSGNTLYYRIVLVSDGRNPVTVGSGLKMWNDAEDLARLLSAALKTDFQLGNFCV